MLISFASKLYVWRRDFPSRPVLKRWDEDQLRFLTVDLDGLMELISRYYDCYDEDSDLHYGVPARNVADRIYAAAVRVGSPLPEASWSQELARQRTARGIAGIFSMPLGKAK